MLSQYFSKNRKGDYYKCCDNCKHKKKNNFAVLSKDADQKQSFVFDKFNPTPITIDKARAEFIEQTINKSDRKIIYEGELDPALVEFPSEEFPELRLNEYLLEYHLFRFVDSDTPIVIRWRLKFDDHVLEPIHFETGPSIIK